MIQVELDDETKRLSDVRPFQPMLKVVEKENLATGAQAEKLIQAKLSVLLGKRDYQASVCYSKRVISKCLINKHVINNKMVKSRALIRQY